MAAQEAQLEKKKVENGGSGTNGEGGISGGGNSATKPTTKVTKSADQLRVLEDYYSKIDSNPCRAKKVELGMKLGLTPRQIQQWFCDQRRKHNKKMMMEEPSLLMNLPQSNGENGEKKKTMGGDDHKHKHKHVSDASSNSGSGSRSIRIVPKARVTPSVRDEPTVAAQWEKMPSLADSEETLGHKRKMASLSNVAKRVRREDEGLSEEAHQIFRELRREALRSGEKEWSKSSSQDLIHQQKQPSPMMGVPSASSSVGYGYCAETGQCFIIRRPNPAIGFPPRPVQSHQSDISKTVKIEPTTTEEKIMQRRLELRDIRRRERKQMQKALKECLALLPCH